MPARKPDREITRWTDQKNTGRTRGVTLIAIHESVGVTNAWDLTLFCERKGVSYHDMVDLTQLVHAVQFSDTGWHLRNGNPAAVGLCLTSPVRAYTRDEWLGPQLPKVEYAAWWVARACAIYGLPLRHCNYAQIRSALRGNKSDGGVITHDDYTQATGDGTHTDPRNFPVDVCLDMAHDLTNQPADPKPLTKGKREPVATIRFDRTDARKFLGVVMAETATRVAKLSTLTFGSTFGDTTFKITPLANGSVVNKQEVRAVKNNATDWYDVPVGTRMVTLECECTGDMTTPAASIWVEPPS